MNLQEYVEMFKNNFIDTVYHRIGWEIADYVSMEILSNYKGTYANIYYDNYCWGSVYYGDEDDDYDFYLVMLTPREIEEVFAHGSRTHYANCLSMLGAFIDSAYIEGVSVSVSIAEDK